MVQVSENWVVRETLFLLCGHRTSSLYELDVCTQGSDCEKDSSETADRAADFCIYKIRNFERDHGDVGEFAPEYQPIDEAQADSFSLPHLSAGCLADVLQPLMKCSSHVSLITELLNRLDNLNHEMQSPFAAQLPEAEELRDFRNSASSNSCILPGSRCLSGFLYGARVILSQWQSMIHQVLRLHGIGLKIYSVERPKLDLTPCFDGPLPLFPCIASANRDSEEHPFPLTLLSLSADLYPFFTLWEQLASLAQFALPANPTSSGSRTAVSCACFLLTKLHEALRLCESQQSNLCQLDTRGFCNVESFVRCEEDSEAELGINLTISDCTTVSQAFWSHLYNSTLLPYTRSLAAWLTNGKLDDPWNELGFERLCKHTPHQPLVPNPAIHLVRNPYTPVFASQHFERALMTGMTSHAINQVEELEGGGNFTLSMRKPVFSGEESIARSVESRQNRNSKIHTQPDIKCGYGGFFDSGSIVFEHHLARDLSTMSATSDDEISSVSETAGHSDFRIPASVFEGFSTMHHLMQRKTNPYKAFPDSPRSIPPNKSETESEPDEEMERLQQQLDRCLHTMSRGQSIGVKYRNPVDFAAIRVEDIFARCIEEAHSFSRECLLESLLGPKCLLMEYIASLHTVVFLHGSHYFHDLVSTLIAAPSSRTSASNQDPMSAGSYLLDIQELNRLLRAATLSTNNSDEAHQCRMSGLAEFLQNELREEIEALQRNLTRTNLTEPKAQFSRTILSSVLTAERLATALQSLRFEIKSNPLLLRDDSHDRGLPSLTYRSLQIRCDLPQPISALFSDTVLLQYSAIFSFVAELHRVQAQLLRTNKILPTLAQLHLQPYNKHLRQPKRTFDSKIYPFVRLSYLTRFELLKFVNDLIYYVEAAARTSWKNLCRSVFSSVSRQPCTSWSVAHMIRCHTEYLDGLIDVLIIPIDCDFYESMKESNLSDTFGRAGALKSRKTAGPLICAILSLADHLNIITTQVMRAVESEQYEKLSRSATRTSSSSAHLSLDQGVERLKRLLCKHRHLVEKFGGLDLIITQ